MLVFAATAAQANAWTPTRQGVLDRRAHVNDMRADRCLSRYDTAYLPRDISAYWRDRKWHTWGGRKLATKDRASQCWPAHHQLWLCIHSGEGDWEDGGWPYWGGLQMGDWFLDTWLEPVAPGSNPPSGAVGPNNWTNAASQYAQERAAENAYRANHSTAFLRGQWPRSSYGCEAHF